MDFMDTRGEQDFTYYVPTYLKSISESLERIAGSLEVIAKTQQQSEDKETETPQN